MPIVRIATEEERDLYVDWQSHNHGKARHDGKELLGRCSTLLAACDDSNSPRVLLPVKLAATLEAMSHAGDATPREIGLAYLALEKAACERARSAGIDTLMFMGSNPATSRAAINYCSYTLLNSPVLRKLITCE